jgi:gas vesicle protein
MNRILLGAAIGAAIVYFFDTERGETRRNRAANWGRQYINSDTVEQAKQATQATVRQAKSLTGQMTDQVSQLRSGRRSSNTSTSLNSLQRDSVPQI